MKNAYFDEVLYHLMRLYCFTEEEGLRTIGISGFVEDFVEHIEDYEFTEPKKIAREIGEEYKK